MFCKSGILIFIFTENNYSIYAHTMLIKTHLLHQSFGPVSFFLFLSLSLSLFLWSSETLWVHFPAQASKNLLRRRSVPSPHWEDAWGLREQSKPRVRDFIGFLCKPRNISLFLNPLLSYHWLWTIRFWSFKGPQQFIILGSPLPFPNVINLMKLRTSLFDSSVQNLDIMLIVV